MNLKDLSKKFMPNEIEFRVGATNEKKAPNGDKIPATKAIALVYVTNRAIQDRLDEVCGPENWKNEYVVWKEKHQLCGISIKIDGEWVTKWDGAENTNVEPLKGGLSASMKRAATQWGIGRYLYEVPNFWVDVVPAGRSYKFADVKQLQLPKEFLPDGVENKGYIADVVDKDVAALVKGVSVDKNSKITQEMQNTLTDMIIKYSIDMEKLKKWGKVKNINELKIGQYETILELYSGKITEEDNERYRKPLNFSSTDNKGLENLNKMVGGKNVSK